MCLGPRHITARLLLFLHYNLYLQTRWPNWLQQDHLQRPNLKLVTSWSFPIVLLTLNLLRMAFLGREANYEYHQQLR
jgi:hypothetical protein